MCTVIVRVPAQPGDATLLLGVRDEDPSRPWQPYGAWWPEHPALRGVHDLEAGGAWLAATPGRLVVALNRLGDSPLPHPRSRGDLVVRSALGETLPEPFDTRGVNLVEVRGPRTTVRMWDGVQMSAVTLTPGTHMIAHGDVDDDTARIRAWRGTFSAPEPHSPDWWTPWLDALRETTAVSPTDDRAIVRDNRPYGVPTLSLLVAIARITEQTTDVRSATLARPGVWNDVELAPESVTS